MLNFKPRTWYLIAACLIVCSLLSVCVWKVVSATIGELQVVLNNAMGKPFPLVVDELRRVVRGDLVLTNSDEPISVVVYKIGSSPTPVPQEAVVALGVDEQGLVRQTLNVDKLDAAVMSAGIVQVASLK